MDRGIFFGGSAYATYDTGGFVRAYAASDVGASTAAAGASTIVTGATNVFVTGNVTAQTSAAVNTINIGGSFSVTLSNSNQYLQTNGVLSNGIAGITGGSLETTTPGAELVLASNANQDNVSTSILDNGGTALTTVGNITLGATNSYTGVTTVDKGTLQVGNASAAGDLGNSSGVVLNSGGNLTFNRTNAYSYANAITTGSFESGSTITQAGTGALTLGNVLNIGNVNTLAITRNVGTGALTLGDITGIGTLADNSTNGASAPTTINQTGTNTIAGVTGANGANIIFSGSANAVTNIATVLSPGNGATLTFTAGTVVDAASSGGGQSGNYNVNGGNLQLGTASASAGRFQLSANDGQTLTISSGTLNI